MGDPDWLDAHRGLLELHRAKSEGYGSTDDALANFVAVSRVTGEPAFVYPWRRMIEKLARCESLYRQGRFRELGEEHEDLAGLALCAEALLRRHLR